MPDIPPAGTPPATPPDQGGQPQQPPASPQGTNQQPTQPPAEFIVSQEQFDRRWGEKMAALEVELGMPLKDIKTLVEVNKKPKQVLSGETLSGTDLKIAKMEALMTAGVPSKQIPLLLQHLNISGKTREEIQTSIVQLIDLKLLSVDAPANQEANQQQQGSPNAAQGAGNTGVPLGTGKKTFTLAEVRDKSKDPGWYEANRAAVQEAMAKGEIK